MLRRREGTRPGRVRAMEVVGRAVKFVEEGVRVWRRLPWRSVAAGETMRVHNGKDLKFTKSDKIRVRVICKKDGCPWEAFCAKIPGEETWQLRKIVDDHTCPWQFKVKLMTSKWLGGKLNNNVRENPSIQLGDIIDKTNHRFHLGITKSKAYRARSHAIDMVDGSYRE